MTGNDLLEVASELLDATPATGPGEVWPTSNAADSLLFICMVDITPGLIVFQCPMSTHGLDGSEYIP